VADRLFLALHSAELLGAPVAPSEVLSLLAPPTYTRALGERFVRQRVLDARTTIRLEQLAGGRPWFRGVPADLAIFLRAGEDEGVSRARLQARRLASVARRLVQQRPSPRTVIRDIRLSRWIMSLRS
jgi:hypothetical protein